LTLSISNVPLSDFSHPDKQQSGVRNDRFLVLSRELFFKMTQQLTSEMKKSPTLSFRIARSPTLTPLGNESRAWLKKRNNASDVK